MSAALNEDFPFLTARNVDDLKDAVRTLTIAITHLTEATKSGQQVILAALQTIAERDSK